MGDQSYKTIMKEQHEEILRLREVNAEMLAALEQIGQATGSADKVVCLLTIDALAKIARAAIAKANGKGKDEEP